MKYKILQQIGQYLQNKKKINFIKRIANTKFLISFEPKEEVIFDLDKSSSSIYKQEDLIVSKTYQAPFDIALQKRFSNAKILSIEVLQNNRILKLEVLKQGSYKEEFSKLYFEFTGRFTNAIIVDENEIIIDALRHFSNEIREIKVGKKFIELEAFEIKEKPSLIIQDFDEFFKQEFQKINEKKLNEIKQAKLLQIDKKIIKLEKFLAKLENEKDLLDKSQDLNKKAKLLIANLYKLKDFEKEISLKDFDGNEIKFTLGQSPKFSANAFFKEAKKLKQKADNLFLERNNLNEKISYYKSLEKLINDSKNIEEIKILLPKKEGKQKEKILNENISNFYIKDFKICLGKNEKGNIYLLKNSKKDDFWFHIKDFPSSHAIVKTNRQKLSQDIIDFTAKLCVNFSVKNSGKYEVDYTKRANVKVLDKANVNYVDYKTVIVDIEF